MLSVSSTHGAGRLTSRPNAITQAARVLRVLFSLLLLAALGAPLLAQEAGGGEANLKLPNLNSAPDFLSALGGIQGRTLLMAGLVVSAFGSVSYTHLDVYKRQRPRRAARHWRGWSDVPDRAIRDRSGIRLRKPPDATPCPL